MVRCFRGAKGDYMPTARTSAAIRLAMRTMHVAGDVPIGYRRGETTLRIAGTPGASKFTVEPDNNGGAGQLLEDKVETRDWLITAALLAPARDRRWLPRPGDEIFQDRNGVRTVWTVGRPADGVPCFRFRDPDNVELRIHTISEREEPSPA